MAEPEPAPAPARFPRRLRNRIVVRIAVLVAGLAVAVGLSTYAIVSDTLLREKERSAEEQFRSNARLLDAALGSASAADVDELAVLTSLRPEVRAGELLWADGEWYAASSQLRPEDLPASLVAAVQAGEPASDRFESTGGSLLAFGMPLDGGRYFEVFDLEELEDTLGTLRRALVASGLLATLAAVAVAWLIARRVTAPLEGVANAATRIASGDLDVRMAGSDDRDLGRIAASFNRMADTLQARIAVESRFAADVSHELRSPMTTLVNAATVLQRRRHELSDDGREALVLLVGDVERFERIIADLTEMSKHDAGTVRPEPEVLPADRAVRDAMRRVSGSVPVEVHGGAEGASVLVDLQLLERVLHTVLENADAYAGGACAIHVDADAATVLLHVDDEGPGVPVDERERIFERFARGVHGERRTTADGSGLGLSLASENMRALGGSITVGDNPAGTGARFTLALPRVGA